MQYIYLRQAKRIRQIFNIADEAKAQVAELKKRVDFYSATNGSPGDLEVEAGDNE